jgi:hypothetical protein
MRSLIRCLLLASLGVVATAGCKRARHEGTPRPDAVSSGGATLTSARMVPLDYAIDRIVPERCERETRCYVRLEPMDASEACIGLLGAETRRELTPQTCPHGVEQIELDKCLTAIRNENCDQPIDVIARVTACRAKTLCAMEPER